MNKHFLFVVLFLCLTQAQECSDYSDCYRCLYNSNITCGWCGVAGKCLPGDRNGPFNASQCVDAYNPNNTYMGWEWHTSEVLKAENRTVGSYLTPNYFEVFLRPGVPLTIPITLTVPYIPPIDFFFLQDASFSMIPYVDLINSLVPQIRDALVNLTANSPSIVGKDPVTFGLGAFLEKPISPFANWPESFVYRTVLPLDKDPNLLISAFNEFLNVSSPNYGFARNYEHPEDSFEGILYAALGGINGEPNQVGWREGVFRIAFVVTDATGHYGPQGKELLGIQTPNNLDNIPDGFPPGTGEDYPTSQDIKTVLVRSDVNPIIGAVGPVYPWWQNQSNFWGLGAAFQLTDDANALVTAILDGTAEALSKAIISVQDDDLARLIRIEPNDGINILDGYIRPVTRLQSYQFELTLLAPETEPENFGVPSTVVVKYVGFGTTVTINITTQINCTGCSAEDPTLVTDICGECGGIGLACLGCDGLIAFENRVEFDVCGVCGGDGSSCIGCDGRILGPEVDLCGICGGSSNTCIGCDGIPNSGKVFYCGVCGGQPNCEEIKTAFITVGTIAGVGAVIAVAAIIFFFCAGAIVAKNDRMLIEKEEGLKQNPFYSEAKKKFDNPTYNN